MNVNMNSMIANTLFGSKTSISSGSFLSASNFGDLSLMRNGVYTKMLKAYYAKQTDSTASFILEAPLFIADKASSVVDVCNLLSLSLME